MHDGLLVSFNGKFLYGLWRPVTAIREADRDGNPATDARPDWSTLIPTPPYPAYPGNMTCMAAVNSRTLERMFGRDDDAILGDVDRRPPGTPTSRGRTTDSASSPTNRRGAASTAAFTSNSIRRPVSAVCIPLADYAFDNYMRRR